MYNFSKFAWVVPLKNKTGKSLVNSFQSILDLGRSPEKLQTDKGIEFLNSNFQRLLIENSMHFFTTNSQLKASVVEHFNLTLKTRMWKYFTAKVTLVYIDILQDIVQGYNDSYHRSIRRAPTSVSLLNVGRAFKKASKSIIIQSHRSQMVHQSNLKFLGAEKNFSIWHTHICISKLTYQMQMVLIQIVQARLVS